MTPQELADKLTTAATNAGIAIRQAMTARTSMLDDPKSLQHDVDDMCQSLDFDVVMLIELVRDRNISELSQTPGLLGQIFHDGRKDIMKDLEDKSPEERKRYRSERMIIVSALGDQLGLTSQMVEVLKQSPFMRPLEDAVKR